MKAIHKRLIERAKGAHSRQVAQAVNRDLQNAIEREKGCSRPDFRAIAAMENALHLVEGSPNERSAKRRKRGKVLDIALQLIDSITTWWPW